MALRRHHKIGAGILLSIVALVLILSFFINKYWAPVLAARVKSVVLSSSDSLYNMQIFNQVCWHWMTHMETFLKTGKGLQYHETFNENEWDLYQKGMENLAGSTAKESIKLAPKLSSPEKMLDIGGSHGLYSLKFCEKYPSLHSTILDLPAAVEKAEPILKKYYSGNNKL